MLDNQNRYMVLLTQNFKINIMEKKIIVLS